MPTLTLTRRRRRKAEGSRVQTKTRESTDLEILRLKAETNRLEVAAYLALANLERIEQDVRSLVKDLRGGLVPPSSGDRDVEE